MDNPDVTPLTAKDYGELVGGGIALLGFLLGAVRYIFRPLFDDTVFNAVRRKKRDVEAFMRDEIFARDISDRMETARLARESADAVKRLSTDVAALIPIIRDLPRLTGSVESLADEVKAANTISRLHGEKISALVAVIEVDNGGRRSPLSHLHTDGLAPE